MAGPLATLRIVLGLDATDVEAGADKAKQSIGGFSTGTKAAFAVVGGAAAAGFGLLAKGAVEAEAAQGKFMAATGRSREEAEQFSKAMNGLVGNAATVGRSFEEITDAGVEVSRQFGITGDDATALTEDVLAFSKVTGTDAVEATKGLEDTLSAYGLSASDAAGFMDQLVASNQKFGTDAGPEALSVLQGMAPALQAMGMGLDDGVEVLNAFEVAGLDAAAAQTGLKKAIGELKPGQDLDDLIAQIGAVEDPLKRAQAAAEIFGAKAGPALAKVIEPGMTSLDEFGVSAEEAAGKTDQAAEDMLTTGDKIRMFGEKAGAVLRGLGQDIGPIAAGLGGIVSVIGAMGPQLATAVGSLWSKAGGSTIVKLATGAAGAIAGFIYAQAVAAGEWLSTAVGSLWGKVAGSSIVQKAAGSAGLASKLAFLAPLAEAAIPIAIIAGGYLLFAEAVDRGTAPSLALREAQKEVADQVLVTNATLDEHGQALDTLAGQSVEDSAIYRAAWGWNAEAAVANGATIEQAISDLKAFNNWSDQDIENLRQSARTAGMTAGEELIASQQQALVTGSGQLDAYMQTLGQRQSQAAADGFVMNEDERADDLRESMVQAGRQAEVDAEAAFHAYGVATSTALGAGISSAEATGALFDSIDQLKDALEAYLTPRQQAIRLIGGDYVHTLVQGMQSADPDLQRASQGLAIDAISTIEQAGLHGKKGQKGLRDIGILYDALLASGMTDAEAKALLAAEGVTGTVLDELEPGKPEHDAGVDTTRTYGDGLRDPAAINYVQSGATGIVSAWRRQIVAELGSNATKSQIGAAIRASMGALHGESPPKEGPLMHIDEWGENVAHAWLDPLIGTLRAGGRAIYGALTGAVPGGAGLGYTGGMAAPGGGVVINGGITVNVPSGEPEAVQSAVVSALDEYVRRAQRLAGAQWSGAAG